MTNPTVVEKQLVDIDLSGGIDESMPEEVVDWTKRLLEATNVLVDGNSLRVRPGLEWVGKSEDTHMFARLGAMDTGLVGISKGNLYHLQESFTASLSGEDNFSQRGLSEHLLLPNFDVEASPMYGATFQSGYEGQVAYARFTKYSVAAFNTSNAGLSSATKQGAIVVRDSLSGQVLRTFYTDERIEGMVGVNDRYLHIYAYSTELVFKVYDLGDGTTELDVNGTTITGFASVSNIATGMPAARRLNGCCVVGTTGSGFVTDGTTTYYGYMDSAGVASIGANVVGTFTNATDIDSPGSALYIVGYLSGAPSRYKMIVTTSLVNMAITRTVTDTTAVTTSIGTTIRLATRSNGNAGLVAYCEEDPTGSAAYPVAQFFTCTTAQTTFTLQGYAPGWVEVSRPFVAGQPYTSDSEFSVVLANKVGDDADYDNVANAVAVIKFGDTYDSALANSNPKRIVPNAVVDGYTAAMNMNSSDGAATRSSGIRVPTRPTVIDDDGIYLALAELVASGPTAGSVVGATFRAVQIKLTPTYQAMSLFGDVIAGSGIWSYDGYNAAEAGFLTAPNISVEETVNAGALTAGAYNYIAVYEYVDRRGVLHRSRVSRPFELTSTGNTVSVYVQIPTVTNKNDHIYAAVYRTTSAGTQYHLLWRAKLGDFSAAATVVGELFPLFLTDNTSDATISGRTLMYRQPGTPGTALDRYHGLSAKHAIQHKDRIFYAKEHNVYFSSFKVDGEAWWFNPAFSFSVPGGTGEITALGSMDGILYVFKKDSVFAVDGDGPPENGGSGADFSPPRRLLTSFGCLDQRTLVSNTAGLMFRSSRGIELLSRSGDFKFIGERIQTTFSSNVYNYGSCFDPYGARCLWVIGSDEPSPDVSLPGDRTVACFDLNTSAWTTAKYRLNGASQTASACGPQDVVWSAADSGGVFMSMPWSTTGTQTAMVYKENWDQGYDQVPQDSGTETLVEMVVPLTVTTGWVHGPSKRDRIRVTDLEVLGFRHSNHNLKCQYATDYSRSSYTTIKTWTASETNLTPIQLEFQPSKESVQAMKFKITTETPTVSTSIGTGRQLDITGLTVRVGLKGGGAKLAATQKG